MTTVSELIEELQKLPGELQVILSKDAEGNLFSPICGSGNFYSIGEYIPESTWAGDFEDEANFEGDRSPINAVCLWPIN